MPSPKELQTAFKPHTVPAALLDLLKLHNRSKTYLSQGFEFHIDANQVGLKTYSEEPGFLTRFIEFAQADGTGSTYAVWLPETTADIATCPLVVFGSEGGVQVVARNFAEWFQLLSFDVEPIVAWDSVTYYKDPDDYQPSKRINAYRTWLADYCQLQPIDNADNIVNTAQQHYQQPLNNFLGQYYDL